MKTLPIGTEVQGGNLPPGVWKIVEYIPWEPSYDGGYPGPYILVQPDYYQTLVKIRKYPNDASGINKSAWIGDVEVISALPPSKQISPLNDHL